MVRIYESRGFRWFVFMRAEMLDGSYLEIRGVGWFVFMRAEVLDGLYL